MSADRQPFPAVFVSTFVVVLLAWSAAGIVWSLTDDGTALVVMAWVSVPLLVVALLVDGWRGQRHSPVRATSEDVRR